MRLKASDLKNYFDVIKFVSGTEDTQEKKIIKKKIKKLKKRTNLVCTKRSLISLVSAMPFIPSLTSLPSSTSDRKTSINSKSSTDDILKELEKLKTSFEAILEKSLESSQNIELIKSFLNGPREVFNGIEIDPYIYMNGKRIENEGKYLNEILGKTINKKMLLTFNLAVISKGQSLSEKFICYNCNQPCETCLKKLNEKYSPEPVVKTKNIFSIFLNLFKTDR